MHVPKLRKAVSPIEGESARGLFCRALAENGVPLSFTVLRRLGVQYRNCVNLSEDINIDIPEMARVLGVSLTDLEIRRYEPVGGKGRDFFGLTVPTGRIEKRIRRFAPGSLAKSQHIRATWELRDIPFCEESWDILVDRCACGFRQGWIRLNGVHRCDDCGRLLSSINAEKVPETIRPELSLIARITNPDESAHVMARSMLHEAIRNADRTALYQVIMLLRDSIASKEVDSMATLEALASACRAVINWPHGLASVVPIESTKLATWRRTYRAYRELSASWPSFMSNNDGSGKRATKELRKLKLTSEVSLEIDRESELVGIRLASELACVTPETLLKACEHNFLPKLVNLRGSKLVPAFLRPDIRNFATKYRDSRPAESVSYRLGITKRALCQIAHAGHLTPSGISFDLQTPAFLPDDIDSFQGRLALAQSRRLKNTVPMLQALLVVNGQEKPWGAIVGEMLAGRLSYTMEDNSKPLFRRIELDVAELSKLKLLQPTKFLEPAMELLTRREALEVVNLYNDGRPLRDLPNDGHAPPRYALSDVLHIAQRGASVPELAFLSGNSLRKVYLSLTKARIETVADGLWLRNEAVRLLM